MEYQWIVVLVVFIPALYYVIQTILRQVNPREKSNTCEDCPIIEPSKLDR